MCACVSVCVCACVRVCEGNVLETISTKLRKRHLEWLGHLAQMPNHCIPRIYLFGWLPQTHLVHGPRKRLIDVLKDNLSSLGNSDGDWHEKSSDRVR